MSLKPWREIAVPHKDVLAGTFKQSEFAADLSQVVAGTAPPEYQDAEQFFARTYITEGMRLLLISVAQRLAGKGGDPVIQLQTAFGGGKTHTLLAVYHLASRKVPTAGLAGIPSLLDEAGIMDLPEARVAVIDGIKLSPSQPRHREGLTVNTLWGELAWQLLGRGGYELVAASDGDGTSPGKEILIELLRQAAPCVILMDELVAFIRQLETGKSYPAGTFDSNISFVQALTEAMKAVPNAILLASLPESEVEAGGTMGRLALEALEKYFARVESVWKPVATEEAFEIVRRRLFEHPGDQDAVEGIARAYAEFYRQHAEKFPPETRSNAYFERLCRSYPIHPEIFDRLYADWSTLEKFQRTRGVLQYMAIVIHRLWNGDNRDVLIMPGTLPLDDSNVRTKSIHYLPPGWEPVIESEIDGPRSVPYEIDACDTRFGSVQAARRVARTIFLGSAPAAANQAVRGIRAERILLGAVQPGQSVGVYEDALKRLRDRLHYLYFEQDRYWFDTRPNLRREMESRKGNIPSQELEALIKRWLTRLLGSHRYFGGIHVFTPSADIPDDQGTGPRLVVLPIHAAYSRSDTNPALAEAEKILHNRGSQPRQYQNRLIFLAADFDALNRLKEQGRTYLAWTSIVDDIESGTLNQDIAHLKQAKRHRDQAEQSLQQMVRETWKWLIAPLEEFQGNKPILTWETVPVSTAPPWGKALEDKLREEEWVIDTWSPIHLRNLLETWYFKNGVEEVSARQVWQDTCRYLYMPRLLNEQVFCDAIAKGVESEDYFGFALGKEGDRYLGFAFGKRADVVLDGSSLLIKRETAKVYKERLGRAVSEPEHSAPPPGETRVEDKTTAGKRIAAKKRFYGSVSLNPIRAKMDFATIVDEVVQQFTAKPDVDVQISVEIQAQGREGFDEALQRIIKENCQVLKFSNAEFEGGE